LAKADLHIHTTASDGRMTAVDLVNEAVKLKLSTIAITDHDTLKGVAPALKAAEEHDLQVITGVEVTTAFCKRECHLLGYAFTLTHAGLNTLLANHKKARLQRTQWIIGELGKKGLQLNIDEVRAEANNANIGHAHIATVLKGKGYVATIREAFIRYLSDEKLGTIKNNYCSTADAVEMIKQAGGVAILAHPGRLYSNKELEAFVEAGIDGVEVVHPSHNYKLQKKMAKFAEARHLLQSGGSDFHGQKKSYYPRLGMISISNNWVAKILQLAEQRNKITI